MSPPVHFIPDVNVAITSCGAVLYGHTAGTIEPVRVRGCDVCVAAAARHAAANGMRLPVGVTHVVGALTRG